MAKKWICTVCGYVAEGETAPEKCPMCGAPQSKFKPLDEEEVLNFVTEHEIGVAKGTGEEIYQRPQRTLHGRMHRGRYVSRYVSSGRPRRLS